MISKRRLRNLSAVALASALALTAASCASSTRSVAAKPDLAAIPPELLRLCADTVRLPDRDLTQAEIARLWGRDRLALLACADRHEALAKALGVIVK